MTGHGFISQRFKDCSECGALLRVENVTKHYRWHEARMSPDEVLAAFREAYRIADAADPLEPTP